MKKVFTSLIAVLFCLAIAVAPASADGVRVNGSDRISILYHHGDSDDGGYAYGETYNTYDTKAKNSNGTDAFGMSASKGEVTGYSGQTNLLGYGDVGYSRSQAEVESFALTVTCPCGYNRSTVSGYVAQGNWAEAEAGPGTWAVGGNYSDASYKGVDYSCWNSHLSGDAETDGFTVTGAYTRSTGDMSLAGGLTANGAEANLYNADCGKVTVSGFGGVKSATYATDSSGLSGGSAGTFAHSGFRYDASGHHYAGGGGIAGNAGYSNVVATPNSVSATSVSAGFASSHSYSH